VKRCSNKSEQLDDLPCQTQGDEEDSHAPANITNLVGVDAFYIGELYVDHKSRKPY
jgi:hypothetical protein